MNNFNPASGGAVAGLASPLVIPVYPIAGESVSELVLRAAAANCYRTVGLILSAAGIEYCGLPAICAKSQGRERELSITLGAPEEEIRRVVQYPVENRPGWSHFFGVPLRDIHRSMEHRRVSPLSLKRSPHLKAIWSVKALSFDPHTKERLLDRCPECSRRPTYLRTYGVEYCEFCSALDELGDRRGKIDFREYSQPIVEVSDLEALDFVTDLIDPEAGDRSKCRSLHTDLRDLGNSVLFELVIAFGLAVTFKAPTTERVAGRHTVDYSRLHPEVLARVGRCLLDWPSGFDALADEVRANAAGRDASYGVGKELGPLLALVHNRHLPQRFRSEIMTLIRRNMSSCADAWERVRRPIHRPNHDIISVQQAAAKYRVARRSLSSLARQNAIASIRPPGTGRRPTLISDAEVAKLVQQKQLAISSSEVAVRLGIARIFVAGLGGDGLITPVAKPHFVSKGREFFERSSVELLERRCREVVRVGLPPEGGVSMETAARSLGIALANPWPQIIKCLLAGKLQAWFIERKSLMRSLVIGSVSELEIHDIRGVPIAKDEALKLPANDAAALIGTDVVKLGQLIARGFLPCSPTSQDLRSFSAEYIFTSEIQRLLQRRGMKLRWREVPTLFRASGVYPTAALIDSRGFVWPRRDVLEAIEKLGTVAPRAAS